MASGKHSQKLEELLQGSDGPLSADEIRVAIGHRKIGLATVYRLLKQGVEEGRFKEVAFSNSPNRYEMAGMPHHHYFLCRSCDRVFTVEGCPKQFRDLTPEGFLLEDHDFLMKGCCSECLKVAG